MSRIRQNSIFKNYYYLSFYYYLLRTLHLQIKEVKTQYFQQCKNSQYTGTNQNKIFKTHCIRQTFVKLLPVCAEEQKFRIILYLQDAFQNLVRTKNFFIRFVRFWPPFSVIESTIVQPAKWHSLQMQTRLCTNAETVLY